jgi:hypothetical protein
MSAQGEHILKTIRSLCIQLVNAIDDYFGWPRTIPDKNARRLMRRDRVVSQAVLE